VLGFDNRHCTAAMYCLRCDLESVLLHGRGQASIQDKWIWETFSNVPFLPDLDVLLIALGVVLLLCTLESQSVELGQGFS